MINYSVVFKRAAFIALLIIISYYVRRDFNAVATHADLLQGIGVIILVMLIGLTIALAAQVHKDNQAIRKKLGEETYNWLIKDKQ